MLAPLPIDDVLPEVLDAVREGNLVLQAPTGAGKTTRVPRALLGLGLDGLIVVLEPRRVAARAAALRMAEELGESVGETVGYQVRLDRRAGPRTRILVVTEGVLLRRLVADPLLDGVAAVVLDEIHERPVDADLVLAMARHLQRELRPELRLIAMSATLDTGALAHFLDARVVRSEGRSFPVAVRYAARADDRELPVRVGEAVREALAGTDGDVLVFLPGAAEIRACGEALTLDGVDVIPLHGNLPPEAQDRALKPGARRRVILATNVAETSVTIPSVRAVVDSGLVRRLQHDPRRGLDRLRVEPTSRASADQRAGRAGRVAEGTCWRLWTERDHATRAAHEDAEIHRVDLAGVVLSVVAWGEPDPSRFPWFEAPPVHTLDGARELLQKLGALGPRGLTDLGRALARLPASPRLGRLLAAAHAAGVTDDGAAAAALLQDRLPLRRDGPPTHRSDDDVEDLLDALRGERAHGWRPASPGALDTVRQGARQLAEATRRALGPEPARADPGALRRALLAAWPDRVARRRAADRYTLASGRGARLHPDSAVRGAEWVVAVDVRDADDAEAVLGLVAAVDPAWLDAPDQVEALWDPERDRVVGRRVARWGALVLREQQGVEVSRELAAAALLDAARRHPDRALPTQDPDVARLLGRLRFLARHRPDLGLPAVDEAGMWEVAAELAPRCRRLVDLRDADWCGALLDRLAWKQREALDALAPERVPVPSGSQIRLDYPDEGPPVLAVRIQELFGCADTPRVAGVPVRLHLLAPNGRPQQVTDDLAGFWQRAWPEVRKELRGRYPKHAWPEDPLAAPPQARPGRPRASPDTVDPRRKG